MKVYPYQLAVLLLIDLGFWVGYTNAENKYVTWDSLVATLVWAVILLGSYLVLTAIHEWKDRKRGGDNSYQQ